MADRGPYQSVFASLLEDDAFIALSPTAKAVWYTLKIRLPAPGIGVLNPRILATLVNCSVEELEAASMELAGKWIRREGNTWWIVNGLRFQPSLSFTDKKHRQFITRQLAPLAKSSIGAQFRAMYAEWFDAPLDPEPTPIEAPPEAPSEVVGSNVEGSSKLVTSTPQQPTTPDRGPIASLLLMRLGHAPRAVVAVAVFLDRCPPGEDPEWWAAEVNGWMDGLNTPRMAEATPEHITAALVDFCRKKYDYAPVYVRSFLERAMRQRDPPARASPRRGEKPAPQQHSYPKPSDSDTDVKWQTP